MLNGKKVLITGGTGSFGKHFVKTVIERYPKIERLVIFSRDELKQFEMSQQFSPQKYDFLRYFIGDVRDGERLRRAAEGIDIIIHAAALKQVPAAEYNPMEYIKTNVLGADSVINAAFDCGVEKVIALSTDKAAAPINLYGATKLCSDKLFVAANNIKGARNLKLAVVRYGNVLGSRGSVAPLFLKMRKTGRIPVTDKDMTRFSITLSEGVEFVLRSIERTWGGEIFVPKIPSYNLMELAKAAAPDCEIDIVGTRPGEKLHEEMITSTDAPNTLEFEDYFVITPSWWADPLWDVDKYLKTFNGKRVSNDFRYHSGNNSDWLDIETLRSQIKSDIDPSFMVN